MDNINILKKLLYKTLGIYLKINTEATHNSLL